MKPYIIILALATFLFAYQGFAEKELGTHTVMWSIVDDYAIDEKGNIVELTLTTSTTDGTVTMATFKAKNAKGNEYAIGNFDDALGADSVYFLALYKKVVILAVERGSSTTWFSYKITKKGATKIGEHNATDNQNLYIFGNKIVLVTSTGDSAPYMFNFDQYNIKLEKKGKSVSGMGDDAIPLGVGRGVAFKTDGPGTTTIKIVKP